MPFATTGMRVPATEMKRVQAETRDLVVRVDDRHELRTESVSTSPP